MRLIKWFSLLLFSPSLFAYSIYLYPVAEFSRAPVEELPTKVNIARASLTVEDFEDTSLDPGLRTTLTPGLNPDPHPGAWDGKLASAESNSALFEFDSPGVRLFGVGIGDNDGGGETLSINGGWHARLGSFRNHGENSGGKAYYLVVVAEENDPDLQSVSIGNGHTMAFDHVVLGRATAASGTEREPRDLPVVSRRQQLENMADRVRRQQSGADPVARTSDELVVNGGFEEMGPQNEDGLRGQFGEFMFAPGSTRLIGWTIRDAVVGLRDHPPSPAGGQVMELAPRDPPGAISQRIKTEPGKAYELKFYTCSGRAAHSFNRRLKVRVGDEDQTIDCAIGSDYRQVTIPFSANSTETELVISGLGSEGFGPVIDGVSVQLAK